MEISLVLAVALYMVALVSFLFAVPNLKIGEFTVPDQVRVFALTTSTVSAACGTLTIVFCTGSMSLTGTIIMLVLLFLIALACCILALPHFTLFKTVDERIGVMVAGVMVFVFAASFSLGMANSWEEERTLVTATGVPMEIDTPHKQVCIDGALWYIFGEETPVQVFEKSRNGLGVVPKACRQAPRP